MTPRKARPLGPKPISRPGAATSAAIKLVTAPEADEIELGDPVSTVREREAIDSAGMAAFEIDLKTGEVHSWGNASVLEGVFAFEELLDLVHPDDRHGMSLHQLRLVPPGTSTSVSFRLLLPSGDGWMFNARGRTMADRSGRPGLMVGTAAFRAADSGVETLAGMTPRQSSSEELPPLAMTDDLTGLPNRALLLERMRTGLSRLARAGGHMAVIFIDVDRFKLVNDSLGHSTGDLLLAEVAHRVRSSVRPSDTVVRFGGDEFVVLCDDADAEQALQVAERLLSAVRRPLALEGREIAVSASVGIAVTDDPDVDPESVLSDADAAMYRAKERGRGRVELFTNVMRQRSLARLEVEIELRNAIERGELEVFYQPIVDTKTERVVGAEALVRWRHPERGLLPPSEFIDLAEETGLVVPLGTWVLDTACRQVSSWPTGPDFRLAVNFSGRQISRPDAADVVARILRNSGWPASRLCLEITETTLMEDAAGVTSVLHQLAELGVQLAVDDFGTGYSSLLRLRRFPVNVLKLDRLFVSGLGRNSADDAIVQATADLARALGVVALAEGVERPDQLERVLASGCQLAQGFLWSPPVPEVEIKRLLEAGTATAAWSKAGVRGPVPLALTEPDFSLNAGGSRCRVVLVDDSAGDRSLLREMLAGSGAFAVVGEAVDADSALTTVTRSQPDLILLDMSLPGRDGLSVLPSLHRVSPTSRVVILSGFASNGLAGAAQAAGASGCLDKSLSTRQLIEQLAFVMTPSAAVCAAG